MTFEDNAVGRKELYNYLLGILRYGYPAIKETIRNHRKELLNSAISRDAYKTIQKSLFEDNDYIPIFTEKSPEEIPRESLLNEFANYINHLIATDSLDQRVALLPMFAYIGKFFRNQEFNNIKVTVEKEKSADVSKSEFSFSFTENTSFVKNEDDVEIETEYEEKDFLQLLKEYCAKLSTAKKKDDKLEQEYLYVNSQFKFAENENKLKSYDPNDDVRSEITIISQTSASNISEKTDWQETEGFPQSGNVSVSAATASWVRSGGKYQDLDVKFPTAEISNPKEQPEPVEIPGMELLKEFVVEYNKWWEVLIEMFVLEYKTVLKKFPSFHDQLKIEHVMQIYSYGEIMRQRALFDIDVGNDVLILSKIRRHYFDTIDTMTKRNNGSNIVFIMLLHGIFYNLIEAKKTAIVEKGCEIFQKFNAWQDHIKNRERERVAFFEYFKLAQQTVINKNNYETFVEKANLSGYGSRAFSVTIEGVNNAIFAREKIGQIYSFYKVLFDMKQRERKRLPPSKTIHPNYRQQIIGSIILLLKAFVVTLCNGNDQYVCFFDNKGFDKGVVKKIMDEISILELIKSKDNALSDIVNQFDETYPLGGKQFAISLLGREISLALRAFIYWQIRIAGYLYPSADSLDLDKQKLCLDNIYNQQTQYWHRWKEAVDTVFYSANASHNEVDIQQGELSIKTSKFCLDVKRLIDNSHDMELDSLYQDIDKYNRVQKQNPRNRFLSKSSSSGSPSRENGGGSPQQPLLSKKGPLGGGEYPNDEVRSCCCTIS